MKKILALLLTLFLALFPLSISVFAQSTEIVPEIKMEHNMNIEDQAEFDEDEEWNDLDDDVYGYDTETADGITIGGDIESKENESETINSEEVEGLINNVEENIGKILFYSFMTLLPFIVIGVVVIVLIVVIIKKKKKK